MHRIQIFCFDISRQFFRRHRTHLDAADQIGAEALEMAASDPSQFPGRFFLREGNLEIAPREAAIFREQQPGAQAHEISDGEQNAHRKCARDRRARAIQEVNAEIEHAGISETWLVNWRRSVNLAAPCFNQYNVAVLRSPSHSVRADFAQFIAHKFGHGPFLVISQEQEELERQFKDASLKAIVCASVAELASAIPQNGSELQADLAIWFYPPEKRHDERA